MRLVTAAQRLNGGFVSLLYGNKKSKKWPLLRFICWHKSFWQAAGLTPFVRVHMDTRQEKSQLYAFQFLQEKRHFIHIFTRFLPLAVQWTITGYYNLIYKTGWNSLHASKLVKWAKRSLLKEEIMWRMKLRGFFPVGEWNQSAGETSGEPEDDLSGCSYITHTVWELRKLIKPSLCSSDHSLFFNWTHSSSCWNHLNCSQLGERQQSEAKENRKSAPATDFATRKGDLNHSLSWFNV